MQSTKIIGSDIVQSWVFVLFIVSMGFSTDLLAQTHSNLEKSGEILAQKKGETGKPESEKKPTLVPTQELLQSLFSATTIEILEDGRVRLIYDFETKEESLLGDWSPNIDTTQRRIRWSQGAEGTFSTVEDGLVIADQGLFLHKGQWSPDVKLEVDFLSMASTAKKDILAAIFTYDKRRRVVGSHLGGQCVRLSKSLKHKGKPIPARFSEPLPNSQKVTFGMLLQKDVLTALRGGSQIVDTAGNKKFLKKLGVGEVGLAWRGRINGFVFKIVIEGTLDPAWLEKEAS